MILPDGRNLNREIVKAGFAWWFRKYAPKDTELEALESEARAARRGLWADPRPVPPWEYRSLLRKGQYSGKRRDIYFSDTFSFRLRRTSIKHQIEVDVGYRRVQRTHLSGGAVAPASHPVGRSMSDEASWT